MNITDEMVERATRAMWSTPRFRKMYRRKARAALTAALGDVEPLEVPDFVLAVELSRIPAKDGGGWHAQLDASEFHWPEGDGPTIDAAIRAAVASARGGE